MKRGAGVWLVTGGAGFIGSHIAEELARRGRKVRVLDDLSTGKAAFLKPLRGRVELVKGDVRCLSDCRRAMKGASVVFHQAAIRAVAASVESPRATHDVNVTGALNVLIAARQAGARRVVLASSSAAYGELSGPPGRESQLPAPRSPYACQKVAAELYAAMFAKTYGLETVCLRYFNVFGPRQDPESTYSAVIPKFMEQAYRGEPLEVHWDGRQSRDFTHVSDVVRANLLAAEGKAAAGHVFNVATGRARSLLDLIVVIERIVGRPLKRRHRPPRPGDVRRSRADVSLARRVLGFSPTVDFESGLRETWDYFVNSYFAKGARAAETSSERCRAVARRRPRSC